MAEEKESQKEDSHGLPRVPVEDNLTDLEETLLEVKTV